MIVVHLRKAMQHYRVHNRERITYAKLASLTGISHETLRSIGSRLNYKPTLGNVEKLCRTLDYPLHRMLEMVDDAPKKKRKAKKKKKKKQSG